MGSGGERTPAASKPLPSPKLRLQPKLLLSAALAALILAAPAGDRTSAAMELGGFAGARFNGGPSVMGPAVTGMHSVVPGGNLGGTAIGVGRQPGLIGRGNVGVVSRGDGVIVRGDPGKGPNPCRPDRVYSRRCVPGKGGVVVNRGDHPGGNDNPGPHRPIWIPPTHVIVTPGSIVPANPTIVTTQPTGTGSPGGPGAQTLRRGGSRVPPADQGVPGRGHRNSAGVADPHPRRHRCGGRLAARRGRKDHRCHRLQRRHCGRGRTSVQGRRCHDPVTAA